MAHPTDELLTYTERIEARAREEGREEGRAEVFRDLLRSVLPDQLGPITPQAAQWLDTASPTQIHSAAHRIFQLESWNDLTRV